jgi:divalent metal cation (Fe/Co/Zn/Cd) transporter
VLLIGTSRDIGRRLLDGVDPHLVDRAEQTLLAVNGITAVEQVRLRWLGHRLVVDATVATDPGLPVAAFHQIEHQAGHAPGQVLPGLGTVRLNPAIHPTETEADDSCAAADER